jgi:predicted membrane-bound mannosyltransferase
MEEQVFQAYVNYYFYTGLIWFLVSIGLGVLIYYVNIFKKMSSHGLITFNVMVGFIFVLLFSLSSANILAPEVHAYKYMSKCSIESK